MKMTREVAEIRGAGYLTSLDVAKKLGIGVTTLLRLDGKAHPAVPRRGKRGIRLYDRGTIQALRKYLTKP
jgi:hypothetical protein